MKQWIKYSLPVAIGLVGLSASAVPITGAIQMSGNVNLGTTDLSQATSATFDNSVTADNALGGAGEVSSGSGAFNTVSVPGPLQVLHNTPVDFFGFTFAPLASQIVPSGPLWSFQSSVTGFTYSFTLTDITSEAVIGQGSAAFLQLTGDGHFDINGGGFDETAATWSLSITSSGSGSMVFGFSDSNTAAVPDGGMTVMMLGAALTGLGLIKRKIA